LDKYRYWIHTLPDVGDVTIGKLLELFEDEKEVYDAVNKNDKDVIKILDDGVKYKDRFIRAYEHTKRFRLEEEYQKMISKGIRFITQYDKEYSDRLRDIDNPPYALYVLGSLPQNDVPSVAIIGARNCSEYGTFVANAFGESLSRAGINIISGMARGIDGISQRGALKADGKTYAVLGSGVDICYPESNYKLYEDIKKKGGIISTFPPGTEPIKKQFPERNRIVAGLADIILVIEAKAKSGTSITVDLGLKMGKDIYAVPGRLTDRLSDGCNRLIRDGAGIALSPEDIIREIGVMWNRYSEDEGSKIIGKSKDAGRYTPKADTGVLKYVDTVPLSVDEIYEKMKLDNIDITLSQTMCELVMLSIQGKLVQIGSGYFYRVLL